MSNTKKCPHGKPESCPECSRVKMVAYTHNDSKTVWYSYFKEEKQLKDPEKIAGRMGSRYQEKHGKNWKKIMFFDNQGNGKPMIGES